MVSRGTSARLTVAVLLAAFAALSHRAVLTKSATYDETLHAVAGHVVRHQHDYRIDAEDPPLFLWWGAFGHRRDDLAIDTRDEDFRTVWIDHAKQWIFVVRTLYETPGNNPHDGFVNRSRVTFLILAILLGAIVAWWGWRLGGPVCAVAAAAFYCLDPNFLAHGTLVKNDVPLALLLTVALLGVWELG